MSAPRPKVAAPTISGAATERFGANTAKSAWEFSTDFAADWFFRPELVGARRADLKLPDYSGVLQLMTEGSQKDFTAAVKLVPKTGKKSDDAMATVNGLALSGVAGDEGWGLDPVRPVSNWSITGQVAVAPNGTLKTVQKQSAVLHFQDAKGKSSDLRISRNVTFYVVNPKGADGWRIDGWTANIATDQAKK